MNRSGIVLAAIGLAACSYQVETNSSEQSPVVTAYAEKVPGKWALLVATENAATATQAEGLRCSQFDDPLDVGKPFARAAALTFKRVAEDVRVVDHPLSHAEFASGGYAGVIRLEIADVRAKVNVEGMINTSANAETEIDGTILVTKGGERMVDTTETGKGTAERDAAGLACGGAADAVSEASDDALHDVVRKLAEQFANSHAIRYSVPSYAPEAPQ